MQPKPRYEALYIDGKRDKARRYVDLSTNQVVSRRQAENLTEKQRASLERRRHEQLPPTPQPPTEPGKPAKPDLGRADHFVVKEHQELKKFTIYRIKAYNKYEAARAYASSKKAQSLKPEMIKIVAYGVIQTGNDSGHEDNPKTKEQWRTLVGPENPNTFLNRLSYVREEIEKGIAHSFDGTPIEYHVMMYVRKSEEE